MLRPIPPPRCRGIPLGDGNYTGCAYGYGDVAPFTGPRDCPVCNGSRFEGHIETTLPHSDFGDPECCGCLNGVIRGDQADIVCNEWGTVLRTVPAANVGQTLTELEIALEVAGEMCPHCGVVNLFPGFSRMLAFTCRQCGKAGLGCPTTRLSRRPAATDAPTAAGSFATDPCLGVRAWRRRIPRLSGGLRADRKC